MGAEFRQFSYEIETTHFGKSRRQENVEYVALSENKVSQNPIARLISL